MKGYLQHSNSSVAEAAVITNTQLSTVPINVTFVSDNKSPDFIRCFRRYCVTGHHRGTQRSKHERQRIIRDWKYVAQRTVYIERSHKELSSS